MDKSQWAKNLLNDPMFQEIMNEMRDMQVNRFIMSDPMDITMREDAYLRISVLDDIKTQIESLATNKLINEKRFKIF